MISSKSLSDIRESLSSEETVFWGSGFFTVESTLEVEKLKAEVLGADFTVVF